MYVDNVLDGIMKKLGLEIPDYHESIDPTKKMDSLIIPWNFNNSDVKEMKMKYDRHCKDYKTKRKLSVKYGTVCKIMKKTEIIDLT